MSTGILAAPTANWSRMLAWNRNRRPDQVALIFEERRWTYAELEAEVDAAAAALRGIGIGVADRVALLGLNSPEYLFSVLAVGKLGAVFVPLNYRLHAEELAYLLQHSGARLLITEPELEAAAAAAIAGSAVESVISFGGPVPAGWLLYADLVAAHRGVRVPDEPRTFSDLQRIIYTSGTTSRPKGVMTTHGNVVWNMLCLVQELGLNESSRILNFSPTYHVGGLDLPGLTTWWAGGTMILTRRFDPRTILELIQQERVDGAAMVATMIHMILGVEDIERYDLSSLRWMIFGGVAPTLFRTLRQLVPGCRLIEGYGLTETVSGIAYLDEAHMDVKTGSVGRPVVHVDIRVVDEVGEELPRGKLGEVVVRGPKVTPGYWDDPEATAHAHRGGWFHTGDLGWMDGDGYLYIADRLKDMIRSGGENLASAEIERVIYELPQVAEVAVVGVPDPRWQEVPKAFVVLREGGALSAEDLIGHCRSKLGGFKVPKHVEFRHELPRNPSGKVLKSKLKEESPKGV